MSIHVMSWVLRESDAKLGDRLVLLVLADHAKDDGTSAWPSTETIGKEARLSTRQVKRCLDNLERDERIVLTGFSKAGTQVWTVAGYAKSDNMSPRRAASGVTSTTEPVDKMSPEPSLEQPSELHAAAPQRNGHTTRHRNEIWDALAEVFGEPSTPSATRVRGKVAAELAVAGATPSGIIQRARTWPQHFENATLTDLAFAKHYDTLGRKPLRRQR